MPDDDERAHDDAHLYFLFSYDPIAKRTMKQLYYKTTESRALHHCVQDLGKMPITIHHN